MTLRGVAARLAVWLVALTSAAGARPVERPLAFDGLQRTYVLHVPARAAGHTAPLVIVLHGQGGSGTNALEQGDWAAKADAEGFIVVAPDGTPENPDRPARFMGNRRSWNSGPSTGSAAQRQNIDDVGFIRAVIADVRRSHNVDERRIFATGFSNGAGMAFRVGAEMSDIVAAIAPVANGLLLPVERLQKPVSLLMIWGLEDPLNPYAGGTVDRGGVKVTRPSAEESFRRWSALLRCPGAASVDQSRPKITARTFTGCDGGTSASLVAVAGLGHQWPGGRVYLRIISGPGSSALNATDEIWAFFAAHGRGSREP